MFKKNTAAKLCFCLVDAADGSALTGATVTARVSKDGAAQGTAAGSVSELGNGQYVLAATDADMNADQLGFLFTATGAVPVSIAIATTTKLVSELQDLTAAQVNAEVDTAISDAALATAANLAIVDGVVDEIKAKTDNLPSSPAAVGSNMGTVTSVTNPVTVGTNNDKTGYSISGTKTTLDALNDITAASVWAHGTRTLSSFGTLVSDIWAHGTRTLTGFGTLVADIWSHATRLLTGGVNLNADQAVNVTKVGGTAVSGPNDLKADVSGLSTFDPLTDEVTVVAASITAIAVETTSDIEGGILGNVKASTDRLEGLIENSGGDRFTAKALEAAPSSGGGLTVQDIVDGVWDENLASHNTPGTTGAGMAAAGNAGDPWATVLPGSYTGNQAGARLVGIQGKTDLIISGAVTVQSPVSPTGEAKVLKGDDYDAADSRAILWESDDWPSLSGATIKLYVDIKSGMLEFAATSPSAGQVAVELTAAQTASVPAGSYNYALRAVMVNNNVVTLATGTLLSVRVP